MVHSNQVIIILSFLFISSCGYHLGEHTISEGMKRWKINKGLKKLSGETFGGYVHVYAECYNGAFFKLDLTKE